MPKLLQPSFAAGEVSPSVGARVDLAKRAVAVEELENFFVVVSGAAYSRPGGKFIARMKPGSTAYRIIPFEFNSTQTFVIELGNTYARFHTNGAQILDSSKTGSITGATQANPCVITQAAHPFSDGDEIYISGVVGMTELNGRWFLVANSTAGTYELTDLDGNNIDATGYTAYSSGGTATAVYEVTTPWPDTILFDIRYDQSGDIMTLVHPDYEPRELVRVANDNWTLSQAAFTPGQAAPTNIGVDTHTTIRELTVTNITQANPAVVSCGTHNADVGDLIKIVDVVGMVEINNFIYRVASLPTGATMTLEYADTGEPVDSTGFTAYSSGGTLYEKGNATDDPEMRPRQYTVTAVAQDGGEESLRGTSAEVLTITGISQANPCEVTVSDGHGLSTLDPVYISGIVGMTELNDERFRIIKTGPLTFTLERLDGTTVDSTGFTAWSSGGTVAPLFFNAFGSADAEWKNSIRWDKVTGASAYNVYASDSFGVAGFIGQSTNEFFMDNNLAPDYASTPRVEFNPFDDFVTGTDKQPGAVGFHQQRRWLARSNNNPNRAWGSQVGNFSNLAKADPALDDDSIIFDIAARKINAIEHLVSLTDLACLTSGGEYRITAEGGVLTPATVSVVPQSYYGSSKVRPVVAGDVALFITPGQNIRDFKYQFADDKFVGKDITILARHLFDFNTIVDWDFAPSPFDLGFIIRDDGTGLFLTFDPAQDIWALSRCTTRGRYKSTCVVREGSADVIYYAVERNIGGTAMTFLERFDERDFQTLEDAFCVDAGLTLDNPVNITNVTAANPVVVTTETAHGYSNGDTIDLSDIFEIDTTTNLGESLSADYNGTGFTIANVTANTFEVQNEGVNYDGSAFAAYASGGKARKAVTTVGGLWHLEGETVVAAANGYAETGKTVTNGEITLDSPASRVHVGDAYYCRLVTLPLQLYSAGETTRGRHQNVNRLTVQVSRTMGLWFGPTADAMREHRFGLPELYGQPLPAVSEPQDVTMKGDWSKTTKVRIEQRDPLPMEILALIPDLGVGGN